MIDARESSGIPAYFGTLMSAWDGDSIRVLPNERLRLGDDDGDGSHNAFAKMSLHKSSMSGIGLPVSNRPLSVGDVVLTLWKDEAIPARVAQVGHRASLELAWDAKEGERCFVLDKTASRLLTVSMESGGDDALRIVGHESFVSWLAACKSSSVAGDGRFQVSRDGGRFEIRDSKRARTYVGNLVHSDDIMAAYEVAAMSRMLASKGLGALLPIYSMEIMSGGKR